MRSAADDFFTLVLAASKHGGTSLMPPRASLEAARYCGMAREFRHTVAARPFLNRCIVARDVGARNFGISIDHLQSAGRDADLADMRHKLMAFVYVMTGAKFSEIGRIFGRNHSAVSYACDKYASAIRTMISE